MLAGGSSRRDVLRILAGGAVLAAGVTPSAAGEARIERLIAEARKFETISQRIDFISAALRGTRYRAYTLIGGPRRPEQFVLRDDAFDCVTFCETVLAAARARDLPEFETALREIRYRHGFVNWFERNHYFFEWCERNVENKTCRWIGMDGAVDIEQDRRFAEGPFQAAICDARHPAAPCSSPTRRKLETGDIVGFVSRRANLDYFHWAWSSSRPTVR